MIQDILYVLKMCCEFIAHIFSTTIVQNKLLHYLPLECFNTNISNTIGNQYYYTNCIYVSSSFVFRYLYLCMTMRVFLSLSLSYISHDYVYIHMTHLIYRIDTHSLCCPLFLFLIIFFILASLHRCYNPKPNTALSDIRPIAY